LTGLANRTLVQESCNSFFTRHAQPHMLALMVLDVERMHIINESLGRVPETNC